MATKRYKQQIVLLKSEHQQWLKKRSKQISEDLKIYVSISKVIRAMIEQDQDDLRLELGTYPWDEDKE